MRNGCLLVLFNISLVVCVTVVSLLRNVNAKPHKRTTSFSVSLKQELLMVMQVKKYMSYMACNGTETCTILLLV
jgi:hypothetical protein